MDVKPVSMTKVLKNVTNVLLNVVLVLTQITKLNVLNVLQKTDILMLIVVVKLDSLKMVPLSVENVPHNVEIVVKMPQTV